MATQLSSLIVPSLFAQTVLEQSFQKNALTASGVIPVNPQMSAYVAGPGSIFTFPSIVNPDSTGVAANVPTTDSSVQATPETISGHAQKFVKNARNRTFNINGLVENVAGFDPLAGIISQYSNIVSKWRQTSVLSQLKGLLATGGALAGNLYNIASESVAGQGVGTKISTNPAATIISGLGGIWGDAGIGDVTLVMHTDVYYALAKQNTTAFTPLASQSPLFLNYLGYQVLLDDTVGKRAGTTDGLVYTIYAMKRGAIEFGVTQMDKAVEIQQAVLQGNGAGGSILALRDMFAFHVVGSSFTATPAGDFPTDTELATAGKWAMTYGSSKQVGVAALQFNL